MLDRCSQKVQSLLFGCLACLVVASVANADGRVFVLDLRNSSSLQSLRDAEQACASQHARLASAEELRHAVLECFFSPCTRGWLHGGTVGTTVCNIVGSALKAVDVRIENGTDNTAQLDAFCVKDEDVPCGDPPSFPNARLQGHSGFEMGDELLYTCVPGYVMPSGQLAFSLLCDSCGEWYGLVQLCVKDHTESHIDYEDKFTDSYGVAEGHNDRAEEAHGEVHEEVHEEAFGAAQEQQETSFHVEAEEEHQDDHGEQEVTGQVIDVSKAFEGAAENGEEEEQEEETGGEEEEGEKEEEDKTRERAVEDFKDHPRWEQERVEEVGLDTETPTEEPVSLLSQKHLFWFPSEAFQEEGAPVSTNPATQTTQRASGGQSEESKEQESQEEPDHQHPVDPDDHDDDRDRNDDGDDDHDNSRHDDQDTQDSHYDDREDGDSHQHKDHDHHVKHPARYDEEDRRDRHEDDDDHDEHYDMGEHEEESDRVPYGSREFDDRDETFDEQESDEDRDHVTDDHDNKDRERPDVSEEHPEHDDHDDHDDGEESLDLGEDDRHDRDDHDDHDDPIHKDIDDPDSHEDDDGRQRVIFSVATENRQNISQKDTEHNATTDETWLDGYPVVQEETENGDSTTHRPKPEDRETDRGTVVKTTDQPNEVEIGKPGPYTTAPEEHASPTVPELEQGEVEEVWPGFIETSGPVLDPVEPSDSPSVFDTLDYDTQQAAPTLSWLGDLTEDPLQYHGPAPPVHSDDSVFTGVIEEHTVHTLPGETGERGDAEGEMEETICVGDECPPHPPSSSTQGPTVAAIIVAVCVVATAVIVGVWCYQRRQRKSSMYEMNGKGQSQSRQAQQIEMQQKV